MDGPFWVNPLTVIDLPPTLCWNGLYLDISSETKNAIKYLEVKFKGILWITNYDIDR